MVTRRARRHTPRTTGTFQNDTCSLNEPFILPLHVKLDEAQRNVDIRTLANSLQKTNQWRCSLEIPIYLLQVIKTNILASRAKQYELTFKNSVFKPRLYKPIAITCGLMFFQRFSGANAFNYYAVIIFRQTLGGMNPHGATIAIGFVQLLASLLSGTIKRYMCIVHIHVFRFLKRTKWIEPSTIISLFFTRISDRHRGQAAALDSQHCIHVPGVSWFRQLCILRVANAKFGLPRFSSGRAARLDTVALRARLHNCSSFGHIANFVVIDWRALSPGVSRPRLEHQHELQLLLRVRRD